MSVMCCDTSLHGCSPTVADGECQGIGGVRRAWRLLKSQDPGDHQRHLLFVRATTSGDRGLHFRRRVEGDRDFTVGGCKRHDPRSLRGPHGGGHLILGKHPLNSDDVRCVDLHPFVGNGMYRLESVFQRFVRTTSTSNAVTERPGAVSISARPHRVKPGSTPMTRIAPPCRQSVEPTFETLPAFGDYASRAASTSSGTSMLV